MSEPDATRSEYCMRGINGLNAATVFVDVLTQTVWTFVAGELVMQTACVCQPATDKRTEPKGPCPEPRCKRCYATGVLQITEV